LRVFFDIIKKSDTQRRTVVFDVQKAAGIAAGILSLAGVVFYIVSISRSGIRPNRATWFIWTLVDSLLVASYYTSGARDTIWLPLSYAVTALVVAFISLTKGEGGWTTFDRACLIGTGIALVPWLILKNPLATHMLTVLLSFSGALPTLNKLRLGGKEDRLAWVLLFAGGVANVAAVERWTLAIATYPVYVFLCDGAILLLAWRNYRQ
jgi:hypothetical protein